MKVLVTGASGFLGRSVVSELLRRGHAPRALVRTATDTRRLPWGGEVQIVRGDVRVPATLRGIARGTDAIVHSAGASMGDPEEHFTTAVIGTEQLIAALDGAPIRRMVLASSVTVYDWSAAHGTVTENTPTVSDPWPRGGYTVAKLWQERVASRGAEAAGFELTILRPGFIWGPGRENISGVGLGLGPAQVIVLGRRRLPLTHVDNCADCFVTAVEHPQAANRVYNVIDGRGTSPWRYSGAYLRGTRRARVRIPVPYPVVRSGALLASATARRLFAHGGRLPSFLDPPRSEARFKSVRWTSERLERELGWQPPLSFAEAARRTYGQCSP